VASVRVQGWGGRSTKRGRVLGRGVPLPIRNSPFPLGEESGRGQIFCFVISKWRILVNSEVLTLKFFCIMSSLSGVWVDSVANFGFSSKTMKKVIIKCCHWARTTIYTGLLYPNVRNNIGGDVSPASPAALTPVD